MTTLPASTLTADEYLATGDERPRFTELINGEVIVNTPNLRHQRIEAKLQSLLYNWCEAEEGRGEAPHSLDARLDTGNVFAPDVWWVAEHHRPGRDATHLVGPPDLAVEVRSPSTWRFDVGTKKQVYERAGLPELWLLDTASDTILVYRRSSPDQPTFDVELEVGAGDVLESPMLLGFQLEVGPLFDR